MGRRKVREEELSDALAELEAREAGNIAARPAGVEGWYAVSWDEPGLPTRAEHDDTFGKIFRRYWIVMLAGFTALIWILAVLLEILLSVLIQWTGGSI